MIVLIKFSNIILFLQVIRIVIRGRVDHAYYTSKFAMYIYIANTSM